MEIPFSVNRARWDELVPIHAASSFYDLEGFRRGRSSLGRVVRDEVGDVAGQSMLHLQCHFGMDTLSWARLGARLTGVDFSAPAIDLAKGLAAELELDAEFVCCDVYDVGLHLEGRYEIVFSSYGVLTWLPDLDRWAHVVAEMLEPGGRLHLIELHPFVCMSDDETIDFRLRYPYFHDAGPIRIDRPGSYAAPGVETTNQVTYTWAAGISDVVTALLGAGLRIESLREYPHCPEQLRLGLVQGDDGLWRSPSGQPDLPLSYAVRATKPSTPEEPAKTKPS